MKYYRLIPTIDAISKRFGIGDSNYYESQRKSPISLAEAFPPTPGELIVYK